MTLEELGLSQQEAQDVLEVMDRTGKTIEQLIAEGLLRPEFNCEQG